MATKIKKQWQLCCLLAVGLLFFNCRKPTKVVFIPATITGINNRVCVSGQGLVLTFNGETTLYEGNFCLADNSLEELDINSNTEFPMAVGVDTTHIAQNCTYPVIHLRKMVKR